MKIDMLDHLFNVHRDPSDIDFDVLWRDGIFVFDSNVLLDLYRLPEAASNDLIAVFKDPKFNGRIWIAFQVAVEFLNNRHEAISDQKNAFTKVAAFLGKARASYDAVFEELSGDLASLKLKQRHSLINPDKFITSEKVRDGRLLIDQFAAELSELEKSQSDVNDKDELKKVVFEIFENKIGTPLSQDELNKIYKDGEIRYASDIPPGYKDRGKKGEYAIGDLRLMRKFGDLILWHEIMQKAKTEGIKNLVLVTGDVKEDWWLEKRGKKLGARKELLNEIYTAAPALNTFHIYDTAGFLNYARSHLKPDIKETSIEQAKELIEESRAYRSSEDVDLVPLEEFIKMVAAQIGVITVNSQGLKGFSVKINTHRLYACLSEIFANAMHHSADKIIHTGISESDSLTIISFKNKVDSPVPAAAISTPHELIARSERERGLQSAQKVMKDDGVGVTFSLSEGTFLVELSLPTVRCSRSQ